MKRLLSSIKNTLVPNKSNIKICEYKHTNEEESLNINTVDIPLNNIYVSSQISLLHFINIDKKYIIDDLEIQLLSFITQKIKDEIFKIHKTISYKNEMIKNGKYDLLKFLKYKNFTILEKVKYTFHKIKLFLFSKKNNKNIIHEIIMKIAENTNFYKTTNAIMSTKDYKKLKNITYKDYFQYYKLYNKEIIIEDIWDGITFINKDYINLLTNKKEIIVNNNPIENTKELSIVQKVGTYIENPENIQTITDIIIL